MDSENRNHAEVGSGPDKLDYQKYNHEPIDLLTFIQNQDIGTVVNGQRWPVSVRIYLPEIRIVSRIGVTFKPKDPNDRTQYNLSTLNNEIVAYRCIHDGSMPVRVGEIVGKNGVPLIFPKSRIDGIAFQNEDDLPYIDVDLNLGFPGVAGRWLLFYHGTSNNKLKKAEWENYISQITVGVMSGPKPVLYSIILPT
jgi:hypothetical protein